MSRAASPCAAVAALLACAAPAASIALAADSRSSAAAPAAVPAQSPPGSPAAAPAEATLPAELRLRRNGDEHVLTDERGFSLYTSDEDALPNESRCVGDCAKAWPPVLAAPGAGPLGEFTLATRPDGTRQWAFRGKPLYRFAREEYAGGSFGDGVANRWRLAFRPLRTPPGIGIAKAPLGRILVNERGQPLFTPVTAAAGPDAGCDAACLTRWAPLQAPALGRAQGDWSLLARADGTNQWAYRQQPLYTFRADRRAADLKGFEANHEGWQPIVVQPELPAPAWATLVKTDVGQVFADAQGLTIYSFNGDLDKIRRAICDQACLDKAWTRLPATADATPVGDWTVKPDADGKPYWTYRGAPLYRFLQDQVPGEVLGNQFAAGSNIFGSWTPIVRIPY